MISSVEILLSKFENLNVQGGIYVFLDDNIVEIINEPKRPPWTGQTKIIYVGLFLRFTVGTFLIKIKNIDVQGGIFVFLDDKIVEIN